MKRSQRVAVCALLVVLAGEGVAWGQLPSAAAAPPPPTVWQFLGIPQGYARLRDSTANRKGNRPNRERKPPLKALADPANLKSDVPAIKAAAEIKAQQDLAPQKIKAIKYLAQIGCGCYGGVAEALQAALEDCVEEVRFAAAEALETAMGNHCEFCQRTCCTPALSEKMYERAYGRDEDGCYIEPSDRVRAVLARVVSLCPPDMGKELIDQGPPPVIDVPPTVPPRPMIDGVPGTLNYQGEEGFPGQSIGPELLRYDGLPGAAPSSRRGQQEPTPAARTASRNTQAAFERFTPPVAPPVAMTTVNLCGEVIESRSAKGFVRVAFHDNYKPAVGTELDVYHSYVLGTEFVGTLVIRDWEGHHAIAAPKAWEAMKIARGDHVECVVQVPAQSPAEMPPETPVGQSPATTIPLPPVPEVQRAAAPTPAAAKSAVAANVPTPAKPASRPTVVATATKATAPQAAPAKEPTPAVRPTPATVATRPATPATTTIAKASSAPAPVAARPAVKATNVPPGPTATSKAVPAARPAATPVATGPAPVVKPTDAPRPTRAFVPAATTTSTASKPAAVPPVAQQRQATSGSSGVLSEMLRLPAVQAEPASSASHSPAQSQMRSPTRAATSVAQVTAVPIVRPQTQVVPASANMAPRLDVGIDALPPIVTPSQLR